MFGRPLFLHMHMLRNKMSTVALFISVSEGHAISEMAKILSVRLATSLCEVLQEVGFDDRVDDVLMYSCSVQTAMTDTFSKDDD